MGQEEWQLLEAEDDEEDNLGSSQSGGEYRQHQVSFGEAAEVFEDLLSTTVIDLRQAAEEERFITLGVSKRERLLTIGHADSDDEVRIITARDATKKERRDYED